MVPQRPTRRDALRLSGLALLGLAGCATQGSNDPTAEGTPTPTATVRGYRNGVDAPATKYVSNSDGDPAIRSAVHTPSRDETAQGEMESGPNWRHEHWFVTGPTERDALEFTDSSRGVDAARTFVADTDLSTATLLVQQFSHGDCTSVELERLEWTNAGQASGGRIDLRAVYDDHDDCGTDTPHGSGHEPDHADGTTVSAIVARIPVDAGRVDGFEYGW